MGVAGAARAAFAARNSAGGTDMIDAPPPCAMALQETISVNAKP